MIKTSNFCSFQQLCRFWEGLATGVLWSSKWLLKWYPRWVHKPWHHWFAMGDHIHIRHIPHYRWKTMAYIRTILCEGEVKQRRHCWWLGSSLQLLPFLTKTCSENKPPTPISHFSGWCYGFQPLKKNTKNLSIRCTWLGVKHFEIYNSCVFLMTCSPASSSSSALKVT